MNQFKNVFTGLEKRDYKTAASSQKCIRAGGKHNDLENVGFTVRHNTFFEMLGNFSFGDYFKEAAIAYAWEYVTRTLGLDSKRLYATVFTEDDEAERLWKKIAPDLGSRVLRFGEKDNFWAMGDTGPCGPCSEIHYDLGESYIGELNGEGDRFMEIWNLVFMQYNRDESGNLSPLPKPSVDTGAGLERFCMILQNAESNYETDLFQGLIEKVAGLSGIEYTTRLSSSKSIDEKGVSHRVIADHVRALTFAIADGGVITNEGRGYVLRRILRRAARHGHLLGMHEPFLHEVVDPLVKLMGGQYPEIKSKKGHIELVIKSEEEQFGRTLDTGLEIFEDITGKLESTGSRTIPGQDIFRLYDTFGFPVDLTEVMAKERGLLVDMEGFEKELEKQKERSRKDSKFQLILADGIIIEKRDPQIEPFIGYSSEKVETEILGSKSIDDNYNIILKQTPFYAESGGQVGDTGYIFSDNFKIRVEDTQKQNDEIIQLGRFKSGDIFTGYNGMVTAEIDHDRRADIRRNHTATHLLHKALKMVLGEHVNQSGSLVAPDRLRFDFTHPKAMTDEEIEAVENIVKEKIRENLKVEWFYKPFDEARKMGAVALFGEKYGDTVRVVVTGDLKKPFSMELCGGTHVDHTADIEDFFITQEGAIAAGIRRMEALTGRGLREFIGEQEKIISNIKKVAGKNIEDLTRDEISKAKNEISRAHRRLLKKHEMEALVSEFLERIDDFQKKQRKLEKEKLYDNALAIEPAAKMPEKRLFVYLVPADNTDDLMVYVDRFKSAHRDSTVVTISNINGILAITSFDDSTSRRIFEEMKNIDGVRGGGKPTIRGSVPVEKIGDVIIELKRNN
jgi:alanyl-tRNA synthetase